MNSGNHSVIRIKGARQHNLNNLDVEIPRNRLVVITGLSGSGKSSLAFDTLYAEGQRKYVESLSAYARQFLDQMQKPEVDYIEGLSPAIAIEQRTSAANPRSTIATTTEIYDYLRLLLCRNRASSRSGDRRTGGAPDASTNRGCDSVFAGRHQAHASCAPVTNQAGEFRDVIEKARREGFVRLRIDGEIVELGTANSPKLSKSSSHTIEAVVDRLSIRDEIRQRLADSIETSLRWGGGMLTVIRMEPAQRRLDRAKILDGLLQPSTGFTMPKLTPKHFSFNSHLGACPACHGIGTELFFDSDLMVDKTKTLDQGAIKPWRVGHKRMKQYYGAILSGLIADSPVPIDVALQGSPCPF